MELLNNQWINWLIDKNAQHLSHILDAMYSGVAKVGHTGAHAPPT